MRTLCKLPHRSLIAAVLGTAVALAAPSMAQTPAPASAPTEAQPLGSTWSDVTRMPDFFTGSWGSMSSFLDATNDTPLTPKAQEWAEEFEPLEDIPFAGEGCKTPGMPTIQRLGAPLKFFYEPGMIAIYIENSSMTRFIKLNGEHTQEPDPTYLGESVAHFEGDTLVVDTIGFHDDILFQYTNFPGKGESRFVLPPDAIFGPHGPDTRMVERMRLLDPDTLEIQLTIYDDTVWTEPYVADTQVYHRSRGDAGWPREWVCSSVDDPLSFDPETNQSVMEDPAEVLKRLKENDAQ